jgi:similar to stage IV sporulation protein
MLLFKILSFLCGYVTITVPEECLEKFINMATARGIFLWGITATGANRVALKVRLSGVQPLRHVARMTRCRCAGFCCYSLPVVDVCMVYRGDRQQARGNRSD